LRVPTRATRLAHALILDPLYHRLRAPDTLGLAAAPLVVRLSAHANEVASPADAQPLDEVLLEDLPEGFFTTRTRSPSSARRAWPRTAAPSAVLELDLQRLDLLLWRQRRRLLVDRHGCRCCRSTPTLAAVPAKPLQHRRASLDSVLLLVGLPVRQLAFLPAPPPPT
jgi:hypothetical protein